MLFRSIQLFDHDLGMSPSSQSLRTAHGTLLKTGSKLNEQVEFLNRATMFNYLVDVQGLAPEVAARRVKELHTDWNDLAPFEKNVMRRLVPFYSFTRRMMSEVMRNLRERPGGVMAQTIKATSRMRKTDATTPQYVANTTSIPLGESPDGGHRYVTGLGLVHEDPLAFGGVLTGDLQDTLLEGLSRMTPLVKAPLEWATGESFFQRGASGGRDIGDMDPLLGRLVANVKGKELPERYSKGLEFALANSPLTRILSTARTATDPRKGVLEKALNLGTGIRITDVSPAAEDAILREHAQKALRELGGRVYTRAYVPAEILQQESPEVQEQAKRLESLMSELAKRSAERKKKRLEESQG